MATFTPGSSEGAMNDAVEVTLVAAPAASTQRLVKTLTVHNKDTVTARLKLSKKKTATLYLLADVDLDPRDTFILDMPIVLDATDDSIVAVLAGAVTTSQPEWTSTYADYVG